MSVKSKIATQISHGLVMSVASSSVPSHIKRFGSKMIMDTSNDFFLWLKNLPHSIKYSVENRYSASPCLWRRGAYLGVLATRVKYSNLYAPSRKKSRALHVCGCEVLLHIPKYYTTLTDVCDRAPFSQSIGWYGCCYINITSTSFSEYSSTRSSPP
jgi:hypothetical protein